MVATSSQFDISNDPSQPINAVPFAAEARQFALTGGDSQQKYFVQGTLDQTDPPAEDSWYTVTVLVGPQAVRRLLDRSIQYRIADFGTAPAGAKVFVGAEEPQTGLMTESTVLTAGEGTVNFSGVRSDVPRAIAGHAEYVGGVVGELTCEITSYVDGVVAVSVKSYQPGTTDVETGDENPVNVFLQ